MLTLMQISALKTLFFGYSDDFRSFLVRETVDDGSDVCVGLSSRFKLGFQGGGLVVRGSVVILWESPLSRLIAIARSMSWFFAVETFSFLHKFLVFRRHCVDVHGVWIFRTRGVLVSSVLSIVLVEPRISSQGSHESSPVVVKKNGLLAIIFTGPRSPARVRNTLPSPTESMWSPLDSSRLQ